MRYKDITMETKLKVLKDRNDGCRISDITYKYNINPQQYYCILDELEYPSRIRLPQTVSRTVIKNVINDYRHNATIETICERYSISTTTYYNILHHDNIFQPKRTTEIPQTLAVKVICEDFMGYTMEEILEMNNITEIIYRRIIGSKNKDE